MYTQIINIKIFYFYFFLCNTKMNYSKSSSNISAIKEVRRLFNDLRSNLSSKETKRIRKNSTKTLQKEQDGTLTNRQNNIKKKKKIARYIKNISRHLKNLKKHLKKSNYQYGLDYLFNESTR